jgi:hypothetical protein
MRFPNSIVVERQRPCPDARPTIGANVEAKQAFVLGSDLNLWQENAPFEKVPCGLLADCFWYKADID